MINVTTNARRLLSEMLEQARGSTQAPERSAASFRLMGNGDEWGVVLDGPREGDRIVERDGDPVLLVGPDVDAALDGAIIETERSSQGEQLVISAKADRS